MKRIQQITHTYIVTPSRDKEPCFEVRGSPENVERAKKEIESYIAMRTGDVAAQQLQRLQLSDSATSFQFPSCFSGNSSSSIFRDSNGEEIQPSPSIPLIPSKFFPPDNSYQPVPANLHASDSVDKPLSPTGSYESNSSDGGLIVASPKQSPRMLKRPVLKICWKCKMQAAKTAALVPCGHNFFCQTCAHEVACSSGVCPICAAQVTNVMHV